MDVLGLAVTVFIPPEHRGAPASCPARIGLAVKGRDVGRDIHAADSC